MEINFIFEWNCCSSRVNVDEAITNQAASTIRQWPLLKNQIFFYETDYWCNRTRQIWSISNRIDSTWCAKVGELIHNSLVSQLDLQTPSKEKRKQRPPRIFSFVTRSIDWHNKRAGFQLFWNAIKFLLQRHFLEKQSEISSFLLNELIE